MHKTILVLLSVVCLAGAARADLWDDLAAYKYGDASNAPEKLHELVLQTAPKDLPAIEKKLIAILESKTATPAGKSWVCRMLQRIATPASVPALAGLLHDKKLSHNARLALERMTDCQAAIDVMRAALDGAPAEVTPGLLGSLGRRRDAKAVAKIAPLTGEANTAIAACALQALGQIGTKGALAALQQAKPAKTLASAHARALVDCAANLAVSDADTAYAALGKIYADGPTDVLRIAALQAMLQIEPGKASAAMLGLLGGKPGYLQNGALRLVATVQGQALTGAVLAGLAELPPATKAKVIFLLGKRGDKAALSVAEYLDDADQAVRTAAIAAVGELGGAPQVRLLLEQTKAPAVADAARKALARMAGEGVDAALIELLKNDVLRAEAAQVLAQRGCREAAPQFVAMVRDPDSDVRLAAWKSMGELAGEKEVPDLMKALAAVKDKSERSLAQAAVKRICAGAADRNRCFEAVAAFQKTSPAMHAFVLELGPTVGTNQALALEREALTSGDADLRRTALRALAAWPNTAAAPDLVRLATEADSETDKILAVRGLIDSTRRIRSERERMKWYKAAVDLVRRPEEKLLLISALRGCRNVDSFKTLTGFFQDAKVGKEAKLAACDVARRMRNNKKFRKDLVPVLTPLTGAKEDKRVIRAAQDCLKNLK